VAARTKALADDEKEEKTVKLSSPPRDLDNR
jgi:hypothetical protein